MVVTRCQARQQMLNPGPPAITRASEPSAFMTSTDSLALPGCCNSSWMNAISVPFGDHVGLQSKAQGGAMQLINRLMSVPSVFIT